MMCYFCHRAEVLSGLEYYRGGLVNDAVMTVNGNSACMKHANEIIKEEQSQARWRAGYIAAEKERDNA